MRLLARTWNLAHGRTEPESRRDWLEEMVRIVTADEVDIVCLQEVPVWALGSLERWANMGAVSAIAMAPRAGAMGRWLTSANPGRLRSALTGQANAILIRRGAERIEPAVTIELNSRDVRIEATRTLGLDAKARKHWARNRRVCQVTRAHVGGTSIVVANMHLTHFNTRLANVELALAEAFASQVAGPATPILLGGDLNIPGKEEASFAKLSAAGYTRPAAGIDHLLGRGMALVGGPIALDDTVRTRSGVRLSDHPIVEAEFEVGA